MALGLRPAVDENAAAWTEAVFAAGDGFAFASAASVLGPADAGVCQSRRNVLRVDAAVAPLPRGWGVVVNRTYRVIRYIAGWNSHLPMWQARVPRIH